MTPPKIPNPTTVVASSWEEGRHLPCWCPCPKSIGSYIQLSSLMSSNNLRRLELISVTSTCNHAKWQSEGARHENQSIYCSITNISNEAKVRRPKSDACGYQVW